VVGLLMRVDYHYYMKSKPMICCCCSMADFLVQMRFPSYLIIDLPMNRDRYYQFPIRVGHFAYKNHIF
jgi:hypothetical protein